MQEKTIQIENLLDVLNTNIVFKYMNYDCLVVNFASHKINNWFCFDEDNIIKQFSFNKIRCFEGLFMFFLNDKNIFPEQNWIEKSQFNQTKDGLIIEIIKAVKENIFEIEKNLLELPMERLKLLDYIEQLKTQMKKAIEINISECFYDSLKIPGIPKGYFSDKINDKKYIVKLPSGLEVEIINEDDYNTKIHRYGPIALPRPWDYTAHSIFLLVNKKLIFNLTDEDKIFLTKYQFEIYKTIFFNLTDEDKTSLNDYQYEINNIWNKQK